MNVLTLGTAVAMLTAAPTPPPVSNSSSAEVQQLLKKVRSDLVFVKGGVFQMGDFGVIHTPDQLPYTPERDNKPLHTVILSDFSILRHKVTYGDYDIYARATGLPLPYTEATAHPAAKRIRAHPRGQEFPLGLDYEDTRGYCLWLGQLLGRTMDLPTEAQWEFAARSRGRLLVFATSNGKYQPGKNVPSDAEVEKISGYYAELVPVGMSRANPLGLHDMSTNGYEWVKDWYSPDYYEQSPARDPMGPNEGVMRVIRSLTNGNQTVALTFRRSGNHPRVADSMSFVTHMDISFRCSSY